MKYELTRKEILIITNALSTYKDNLELKITEWDLTDKDYELIKEILKQVKPLEARFKDL